MIPKESNNIILYPRFPIYLNGLSKKYSNLYKDTYKNIISQEEFELLIEEINEKINNFWPCCFMYYIIGIVFGILSFGITCLLPLLYN